MTKKDKGDEGRITLKEGCECFNPSRCLCPKPEKKENENDQIKDIN